MPVIYADLVWLVNFVMDAVLLVGCAWVAKRKTSLVRILLGAFVGSMYAMLLFLPPLSALTTWPGKAVASLLMVWVAVPPRSWLDLARNCALYYFVAFVFAGAAVALNYAIPGVSVAGGTLVGGKQLAFLTSAKSLALLIAIPLGGGLIHAVLDRARRLHRLRASLHEVEVVLGNQTVRFVGLADTGNQLRHPLTGRPVCLVDLEVLQALLPSTLVQALRDGVPVYDALNNLPEDLAVRYSFVPFRSAGGTDQWILVFRPDEFRILQDGVIGPAARPCLVGIHTRPLSNDGRFQAILHIDVITGDDRLEELRYANQQTQSDTALALPTVVDENPSETSGRR